MLFQSLIVALLPPATPSPWLAPAIMPIVTVSILTLYATPPAATFDPCMGDVVFFCKLDVELLNLERGFSVVRTPRLVTAEQLGGCDLYAWRQDQQLVEKAGQMIHV